jgi:hypothetical protein
MMEPYLRFPIRPLDLMQGQRYVYREVVGRDGLLTSGMWGALVFPPPHPCL